MKKITLLPILLLLLTSVFDKSLAQESCGFVPTQDFMDQITVLKKQVSRKTTGVSDTLPIALHLVADDNGNGRHKLEKAFDNICKLNETFEAVGLHFWIKWPVNYIDNSLYYSHTFQGGYMMMGDYKVPDALNVFIVNDPAGNCGYYSPSYDALAVAKMCARPDDYTLEHEMGHMLNLPHTFSGWEHGNTPSNPELVTRGAGNNCNYRGDKFCDTEADYLSYRWNCPYSGNKTDANGDLYRPDSSNIMSYSSDNCVTRFSGEQMNVMYNNAQYRWLFLDHNYPAYVEQFDTVRVTNVTDTLYNDKKIVWNSVPGADAYHVVLSLKNVPSFVKHDTLLYGTNEYSFADISFVEGNDYIVRIKALNGNSVCTDFSPDQYFKYADIPNPYIWPDATMDLGDQTTSYYISSQSGEDRLYYKSDFADEVTITVSDALGRVLASQKSRISPGTGRIELQEELIKNQALILQIVASDGQTQTLKHLSAQ